MIRSVKTDMNGVMTKKHEPVFPSPVSTKDWGVIKSDITLANNAMNDKENLMMISMAAYHYAQAIEKSLKALIRANADIIPDLNTHDFSFLILQTEMCCSGFVQNHKFLVDNCQELSCMNGTRYGDKIIRKGDAFVLMKEAKRLFTEIEQDLILALDIDKEQLQRQANNAYKDSSRFLSFSDTYSSFKSSSKHKAELTRE